MAKPVADYTGLFDEVLGSDGKTNLRSGNKLKALVAKFGERGFDYAGNSSADLAVWRGAREAIVVNASRALVNQAANCAKLGPTFTGGLFAAFPRQKVFSTNFSSAAAISPPLAPDFCSPARSPNPASPGARGLRPRSCSPARTAKTAATAFRIGYVAGLSFWLASLYWLLLMPVAGFPILGWVALSALSRALSRRLGLACKWWARVLEPANRIGRRVSPHRTWTRRTLWSLAGAAVWVALEMIRARLFGGFPWNFLGASQYQMIPLIQIASVTGVYGVSFLVVWVSLSLYSAVRMIFQRPAMRLVWQAEIFLPLIVVIALFAFELRANGRGKSAGFNAARHLDSAQRPANLDLG